MHFVKFIVKASILRYLLWLFFGLYALVGQAQNSSPDHLLHLFNELPLAKEDTERVNIYYSISRYYWDKDPDSALLMGQKCLDLATAAHYELGQALAWLTMGVAYGTKAMYPEADLPSDKIRYFSAQMGESLKETFNMLDNLLFWARTQMDGLKVDARPFDLVPVLEQNRRLALSRAQKKKITVLTAGMDMPVMAYADEVMIDMVIRNLVDNAIKFSREGDTISLSVGSTPDGVLVTISDTGVGIPLEDQHRIFTSISYTTTGTSREKGSGLGLSLCKEMIDKNGGKIWFDSKPGKGTSFAFTLPGQAG